jgi:hypothetical protein
VDPDELLWLRAACANKLDAQAERAAWYQSYFDNQAGIIALLDTKERETFRTFLAEASANWCELVVAAVSERLEVTGFRFGSEEDSAAAWAIWQANQMDADHEMVQTDALVAGSSFVLVQPSERNPSGVAISPESPIQATVLYEPGDRRRRRAGYKRFTDTEAGQTAPTEVLFTPDLIVTWPPEADRRRPEIEANPARLVGLIEIIPQPRTLHPPRSELTSITSFQDRINTTIFARMVATDYGAFRQIWATGIKLAREVLRAEDGTETVAVKRPMDVGANRLLINEDPAGRFGSFPESGLRGYLDSVEQDVNMLAAVSQTPPHYLLGQMINLSADAIKASEAGLVSKVRRRSLHIGEAWEEVLRTAFTLIGNPAAAYVGAEVRWRDFETRSEAQLVDALVKMATLGVPREALWERWGATQQQVDRWNAMIREQAAPAGVGA